MFWLLVWLWSSNALAAPTGQIAFLRGDAAYVLNIKRATRVKLPFSNRAELVRIAPRGGAVVYFVRPRGVSSAAARVYHAFISRPPYRVAHLLPAPMDRVPLYTQVTWNAAGSRLTLILDRFETDPGRWQNGSVFEYRVRAAQVVKLNSVPRAMSRNGRWEIFQTGKTIQVRDRRTGRTRVVFSYGQPGRLLKRLQGVPDYSPDFQDGAEGWWLGGLSVSADGAEASFVTNAGSGSSAAGGNSYFIGAFSVGVRTGAVRLLSYCVGCKSPYLERSPDGQKLLFAYASHASAADNSWTGEVIEWRSGRTRELIFNTPEAAPTGAANLTWGWSWSPDSKFIALAVNYYDPVSYDFAESRLKHDFKVYVRAIGTGAAVRVIPAARDPSWGRL